MKDIEKLKLGKDLHVTFGQPMPPSVDQEQELCIQQEACTTCPKCYTDFMDHVLVQPLAGINATRLPTPLAGTFNHV